jgi:hypothetical protein
LTEIYKKGCFNCWFQSLKPCRCVNPSYKPLESMGYSEPKEISCLDGLGSLCPRWKRGEDLSREHKGREVVEFT